jgi:enoyl-CoA hydratase/carnithine racemase
LPTPDQLTQITLSITDHIARVSLNNAPVNALSRTMNDELTWVMDYLGESSDARVIVLDAIGKVFCAGADLKGRADVIKDLGDMSAHSRRTREAFHSIRECAKPVIVALNGPALGAGLAIVASADLIIVSKTASLGMPEIDVGLMGGCSHAMRLFSHAQLREMALTGKRMGGEELYRLGVVNRLVDGDQVLPEAMALAASIAAKSPASVRLTKHTMNTIEHMSLRDGYRYEQDMTAAIAKTADAIEAKKAFLEKRPAIFRGD